MNNNYWNDENILDEEDELTVADRKAVAGKNGQIKVARKRKWREIETIKDQRRLRRDIAAFEHYSY